MQLFRTEAKHFQQKSYPIFLVSGVNLLHTIKGHVLKKPLFLVLQESTSSEEVNKLQEENEKLSEELQAARQEIDRMQETLNQRTEELVNAKAIIEQIENAQQSSVSRA